MLLTIEVDRYGIGHSPEYDPRFPGYFSAKFFVKGIEVSIRNIRRSSISKIVETIEKNGINYKKTTYRNKTYSIEPFVKNVEKMFLTFRY